MATPVREYVYSLDQQMMEQLKYSGIERDNLADLVSLFVSIKNKYALVPFSVTAECLPIPNAITARYMVDSLTLHKMSAYLFEIPRLHHVTISPRGIVKSGQYEIALTLGG